MFIHNFIWGYGDYLADADELEAFLCSLLSQAGLEVPTDVSERSKEARSSLLHLCSEQDDCITELLLVCCRIHNRKTLR